MRESEYKYIVLCAKILGGAEIFALERFARFEDVTFHCNATLAALIRSDEAYDNIEIVVERCLDDLAGRITLASIAVAASGIQGILRSGRALLANLRAATMVLKVSARHHNDVFIHDNCHYLNLKTRLLVALVVFRARTAYFPCVHATLRVPFRRLLSSRFRVYYFADYQALPSRTSIHPNKLAIAMIGRIEPQKNQQHAARIANLLASKGTPTRLTLIGTRSDDEYYLGVIKMVHGSNVEICQLEAPRSAIPALLRGQDLILHTSLAESLPLVLFEANAASVPFFALPVGGIPEVLPSEYWLNESAELSAQIVLSTFCS